MEQYSQNPQYPQSQYPQPPVKKKSPALIIALVIILLLLCGCCGLGGVGYFIYDKAESSVSNQIDDVVDDNDKETDKEDKDTDIDNDTDGAYTPESAVDIFYTGIMEQDLKKLKEICTPDFAEAVQLDMFADPTDGFGYRYLNTEEISKDESIVYVQEVYDNQDANYAMSLDVVRLKDDTWVIAGYEMTALEESWDDALEPFSEADAMYVVDTMLAGLTGEVDIQTAESMATERFKNANPGWISPSSVFSYTVQSAEWTGDYWVVIVDEEWQSGEETGFYYVEVIDGIGYVNIREGLE